MNLTTVISEVLRCLLCPKQFFSHAILVVPSPTFRVGGTLQHPMGLLDFGDECILKFVGLRWEFKTKVKTSKNSMVLVFPNLHKDVHQTISVSSTFLPKVMNLLGHMNGPGRFAFT